MKASILLLSAGLMLVACSVGPSDEDRIAAMAALTLTAVAQPTEVPEVSEQTETYVPAVTEPEATAEPEHTFPGDLQPLSPAECEQLAAFMVNRLPVFPPVEEKLVAVEHDGEVGGGCQSIGIGPGEVIPDMLVVEEAMRGILAELGWTEDPAAPECLWVGGWGPGASSSCYNQADALCEVFVHMDPADDALCSNDEPISVCFDRLEPEQILYTVELTCARDTTPTGELLEPEPSRITFDPGATQASIWGEVAAGKSDRYVLTILEGQEMTVNLLGPGGEVIPYDTAVLVIWGEDGTVLISDHADALTWVGELPFTQDYFVNVKSISDQPVPYILEVIIPPP
jgi:hypothetical protein